MRYDTLLLQRVLSIAGYDPGPIDGLPGPKTRNALLAFQQGHDLTPDGVIGPQTRKALRPYRLQMLMPLVREIAGYYQVDYLIILAMAQVESYYGFLLNSQGKGDNGHGHGLMQIDDRSWASILGARVWWEDAWAVSVGTWIYKDYWQIVARNNPHATPEQIDWATVAAYNCGPGRVKIPPNADFDSPAYWHAIDHYTWGHNHAQRGRQAWREILEIIG
ncbi:MAG: peptidoglycan-binding protein [Deltaproteobacteria bacterium]|nr:peptidoglycan-binding protein [Deltaproteobacteria bacterium]